MLSFLEINKLIIPVIIGVGLEERSNRQDIEINIKITFDDLPKACLSAEIEETICYAKLVENINEFCSNNQFLLIEELAYKLHRYLKQNFVPEKLELQICKNPPIEQVKANCCFTIIG